MLSPKSIVSSALLLTTLIAAPCFAADGDLDPDFGTGGIAYITPDLVAAQELQPVSAFVLPDGKILFGGSLDAPTSVPFEQEYRGMLARLNADGTVDTSFGNTSIPGVVALPNLVPGNRMEGIESMQVLADGSIIAVGVSQVNSPERGFIVKLDADGNLDPSFAGGGVILSPATYFHAVGIDSQGRIVVAGEHIDTTTLVYTATVIRFTPDGTPDATFGDTGVATIDWDGAGNSGFLSDLVVGADDGVVVAGQYDVYGDGLGADFAVARLDSTGTLDGAFGDGGARVFHDPSDDSMINAINRISATPDGGIAFAGYYYIIDTGSTALILGHLRADGSTDVAFGDDATPGYFRPAILPTAGSANATELITQPDGKLLVSLSYFASDKENFFALRSTADGQLDATFADAGIFEADLAPDGIYSEASAMTLQPDGNIVIAGRAERSSEFLVDLGVVRLLNSGGPDDVIFANGFDL